MSKLRSFVAGMAVASVAALAGTAPSLAQQYNWTGVYFGANAGMAEVDINGTYVTPPPDKHSSTQSAGIFGGHVGGQYQFGQFVAGAEMAYSGTGRYGDKWGTSLSGADCINISATANRSCDNRMKSLFTVGPRLGWAAMDRVLLFVGGGYASGVVQSRTLVASTGAVLSYGSDNRSGWYLGGGVEWAVTNNILLGLEYQHVDLGSGSINTLNVADSRTNDAVADVVRARLSFKFGPDAESRAPLK